MRKPIAVVWKEVGRIESFNVWSVNGKRRKIVESIHFHHQDAPGDGHVASAAGYDWCHGSDQVVVYVLKPDAAMFKKAGIDGAGIVDETRKAVQAFFEQGAGGQMS